jgi:hypothetical protein
MALNPLNPPAAGLLPRCTAQVHLKEQGAGPASQESIDLYCGDGHQILQWLGNAACAQLALRRGECPTLPAHACAGAMQRPTASPGRLELLAGETVGCYVPQAVIHRDGKVLDVDLVLSEALEQHGAVLTVEYGPGPTAYAAR